MNKSVSVLPKSNAAVGKAFDSVVKVLGRDDVGEILFNWNESELNEDGDKIINYLPETGITTACPAPLADRCNCSSESRSSFGLATSTWEFLSLEKASHASASLTNKQRLLKERLASTSNDSRNAATKSSASCSLSVASTI